MIALLPTTTDWCRMELPHVTLVYAGEIKDLKATSFNELAKDASSLSMMVKPFVLKIIGTEVFGDERKVDVFKLQPTPELLAMRRFVEHWNKSQYPFTPHATIGDTGVPLPENPRMLGFNRLLVTWGTDSLAFWLNG